MRGKTNVELKGRLFCWISVTGLCVALVLSSHGAAEDKIEIPVKGMVTMVDLGAKSCIPCKMMEPILEKLEREYRGRAAIVFIDISIHRDAARRLSIRAIPIQIFFDKEGREVYRHLGFMSEKDIVAQLKKMGVE